MQYAYSIKLLILIFGLLRPYPLGIVVVVGPVCGRFLLTTCTDYLTCGVAVFIASFTAPSTAFCVADVAPFPTASATF